MSTLTLYIIFKHSHSTLSTLIFLFLLTRLYWKLRDSSILRKKWIRISAHVLDTFLLLFGVLLWGLNNWTLHGWLLLKLILVIVYILTAFYALKKTATKPQSLLFGTLSILALSSIIALAHIKPVFFM